MLDPEMFVMYHPLVLLDLGAMNMTADRASQYLFSILWEYS